MKVVVVGAGGFLGTAVLNQFAGSGIEVLAISTQVERLRKEFGDMDNILFSGNINEIPEGAEVLLNCAFPRMANGEGLAEGMRYVGEVLHAAVKKNVGAVINISSQSVYGQRRSVAADEKAPLELESAYAVGKYASELLTESICGEVRHTNIRMASLIGLGMEQRVVNKMIRQVEKGESLMIRGGRQIFGYMDVRDAADALVNVCNCAGKGMLLDSVYNLGGEISHTLMDIVKCIIEVAEEMRYVPVEVTYEECNDLLNSSMISERFYKKFNWRPKISMKETVRFLFESLIFSGGVILWYSRYFKMRETA